MARPSWKSPPAAVIVHGTEGFFVDREVRRAILAFQRLGRQVIRVTSDAEVADNLLISQTLGDEMLIVVPLKEVQPETLKDAFQNHVRGTCVLLVHDGPLDGLPAALEVPTAYQVHFAAPKSKKDVLAQAIRFIQMEADDYLESGALEKKLAEAIVKAAGSDLGTLYQEIKKIATYARAMKSPRIEVDHVKALLKVTTEVDLEPLRSALRNRNGPRVAQEMDRLVRNADKDPLMLLLRSKGGVADLASSWYRTALLLERGTSLPDIAGRLGIAEWIVEKDLAPAARQWGSKRLRVLIENLAHADRSAQLGAPFPTAACESAMLLGCL